MPDGILIDQSVVLVVNRLEGTSNAELWHHFQVLLQLLKSELKVNLLCQQYRQLFLHDRLQIFEPQCPI